MVERPNRTQRAARPRSVGLVERSFFHEVLDVFEGIVGTAAGSTQSIVHRRGLKLWFGDARREHYEAQLVRLEGTVMLEIGFHLEYPKPDENDELLGLLMRHESAWRGELGDEPESGEFLGSTAWRRISEVWDTPDFHDVDAVIEVGARLADYVATIEPLRARDRRGSKQSP